MSSIIDVKVPDIGDFKDVPIIEVLVAVGDHITLEAPIVTLESDKATIDVPASAAGIVREIAVKVGDKVSEGAVLVRVESEGAAQLAEPPPLSKAATDFEVPAPIAPTAPLPPTTPTPPQQEPQLHAHATPSVRAFARELGVDLSRVRPSGPKNRILREDVSAHVKGLLSGESARPATTPSGGGLDLLPWPKVDFAKFGPVEVEPLSRIGKISAQNLARNWVMIPAVTYHEEADITDIEAFRSQINHEGGRGDQKLTLLSFLIKASVKALQKYPRFNASLDGDSLVLKKYFHIAFAADTPNGLVVPVIRDVDKKSVLEIAKEAGELSRAARDGKLKPADMQGACFTISSLGGIGGTGFSPIINAPEVAILGVNKAVMKPVWDGHAFVPRRILPMSLTADHRVIDGALATRFNVYLAQLLADFRRVTL